MNLKRRIKKELDKIPMKPFAEWCDEQGIVLSERPVKKCRVLPEWILAPASYILMLLIVLPIALSNLRAGGENPPEDQQPVLPPIISETIEYGENDIESITIAQNYFDEKLGEVLIDFNKIKNEPIVIKEVPREDSTIDVSYIFKDCFIPFVYENKPYAVYMTYRIKVYEHYMFSEEKKYDDLTDNITIDEYEMQYTLHNINTGNECNLYFKHGDNEYYLYIREVMSQWELTESSLQAFLQYLFN